MENPDFRLSLGMKSDQKVFVKEELIPLIQNSGFWSRQFLSFMKLILLMMEPCGKDYEYEAPVKLLDKLFHEMPQSPDEQIVVVSQC